MNHHNSGTTSGAKTNVVCHYFWGKLVSHYTVALIKQGAFRLIPKGLSIKYIHMHAAILRHTRVCMRCVTRAYILYGRPLSGKIPLSNRGGEDGNNGYR